MWFCSKKGILGWGRWGLEFLVSSESNLHPGAPSEPGGVSVSWETVWHFSFLTGVRNRIITMALPQKPHGGIFPSPLELDS